MQKQINAVKELLGHAGLAATQVYKAFLLTMQF